MDHKSSDLLHDPLAPADRQPRPGETPRADRKGRIRAAFDLAEDYDRHAVVQRQAALWLAESIAPLLPGPDAHILEIGCGTGFVAEAAEGHGPAAHWLMTDIAPAMIARARAKLGASPRRRYLVMDGERPHVEPGARFDLVCSNLTVQWFGRLERSLEGLLRLVKPGGHLVFTTLAAGTFATWREAHAECGTASGTPHFPSPATLRAMLPDAIGAKVETRDFAERFACAGDFLHALRRIGAGTPAPSHQPLAAPLLRKVMRRFEQKGGQALYRVALCRFRRPGESSSGQL